MTNKELKKKYLQTLPLMGVFVVKNSINGKIFLDSSLNVQGKINSCRFQLELGSHRNKELQKDFKLLGIDNFSFDILDYLEPKDDHLADYRSDLGILEEMWLEKLQPFVERGYNLQKK